MTDVAALMKRHLVEIEPEDINSELRSARHSGRQHAGPLVKRDSPHSSTMERPMEMTVFARFHAREGQEEAVAALMRNQLRPVRAEPGCLAIDAYRSTRDPRLFFFHSHWVDEAAFDLRAGLPHTVRFLERAQPLIDHPLDVTRTMPLR